MSKGNHKQFMVRLNLEKDTHRMAWEELKARGKKSYTDMFVDSLCREEDTLHHARDAPADLMQIRQMFRKELERFFTGMDEAMIKPTMEANGMDAKSSFSDEDLNASLDFIDSFL